MPFVEEEIEICSELKVGIFSVPFKLMLMISFFVSFFPLFILMNFKSYGLGLYNNDFLITAIFASNMVSNIIGQIFWGCVLDKIKEIRNFYIGILVYFF